MWLKGAKMGAHVLTNINWSTHKKPLLSAPTLDEADSAVLWHTKSTQCNLWRVLSINIEKTTFFWWWSGHAYPNYTGMFEAKWHQYWAAQSEKHGDSPWRHCQGWHTPLCVHRRHGWTVNGAAMEPSPPTFLDPIPALASVETNRPFNHIGIAATKLKHYKIPTWPNDARKLASFCLDHQDPHALMFKSKYFTGKTFASTRRQVAPKQSRASQARSPWSNRFTTRKVKSQKFYVKGSLGFVGSYWPALPVPKGDTQVVLLYVSNHSSWSSSDGFKDRQSATHMATFHLSRTIHNVFMLQH